MKIINSNSRVCLPLGLPRGLCILIVISLWPAASSAQGPLTPPGPPAPTMKTLDQVEPRLPISSLPYTITNTGSYYLTTNLIGVSGQHGITNRANNVTLDLNGFSLIGVPGSLSGFVLASFRTNITVRNGVIQGWGGHGIDAITAVNGRFEGLELSHNGNVGLNAGSAAIISRCAAYANGGVVGIIGIGRILDCVARKNSGGGIFGGSYTTITGCTAQTNGSTGISVGVAGTIADSTAQGNGSHGINASAGSVVRDCVAVDNGTNGFNLGGASTISGCAATGNGTHGINASLSCVVRDCVAQGNVSNGIAVASSTVTHSLVARNGLHGIVAIAESSKITACDVHDNAQDGIRVVDRSVVLDNLVHGAGTGLGTNAGIRAIGTGNRIEGNSATGNPRGFSIDGPGNLVIRNLARQNTGNYFVSVANFVGPRLTNDVAVVTNHNPHANFDFSP